jgi:hypothetical protein
VSMAPICVRCRHVDLHFTVSFPKLIDFTPDQTEDQTRRHQGAPDQPLFEFDSHTGWISYRFAHERALLRLCWLPPDRRGDPEAFGRHDSHVVVGAPLGTVTIMDFRDILEMLARMKAV